MINDTLTVVDNRTGKSYELPIEHGAIGARIFGRSERAQTTLGSSRTIPPS
jgi:hypothetical protein